MRHGFCVSKFLNIIPCIKISAPSLKISKNLFQYYRDSWARNILSNPKDNENNWPISVGFSKGDEKLYIS